MRLDEILQSDVDAFARIELRRCARKTVNNRLAVLSTMLRYAYENRVIGKPTLRCHVGGSKAEDAPIVAVSAEDVEKLVAAADDLYRVVVLLAVEAGLRVGELRGAQWTDVAGGEIAIRRAIGRRRLSLSRRGSSQRWRRCPSGGCGCSARTMDRSWSTGRCSRPSGACTSAPVWSCPGPRRGGRCRSTACGTRSAPSALAGASRS